MGKYRVINKERDEFNKVLDYVGVGTDDGLLLDIGKGCSIWFSRDEVVPEYPVYVRVDKNTLNTVHSLKDLQSYCEFENIDKSTLFIENENGNSYLSKEINLWIKGKYIAWFSCGVTSAIACKKALDTYGKNNVNVVYIGIKTAHKDNERFISECEKWYGVNIECITSNKYKDQFDVIRKTKYVNGAGGARCTLELKKNVRYLYEKSAHFLGQIFGFEYSKKEVNRAVRFSEQYPYTKPIFPLIEQRINKDECAGILQKVGIGIPEMYKLGYNNNNCKGCVKGGKGYWNKIRIDFPEIFNEMAALEREVGRTCIRQKGKNVFLDELNPNEGRKLKPILPDCGTFCEVEFADIISNKTIEIMEGKRLTVDND